MSCQPCSGCPMRPYPLEESCPPRFVCPSNSPRYICIEPPIPQKPQWKPCCIRKYGSFCRTHAYQRKSLRSRYNDLMTQW
ncbi:hypothetical protein ACS0PU_010102 [Formica fusca]